MKKLILTIFLLFTTTNLFAITEDTKVIIDLINKQFEQVDKRFEQVDKRFEDMQKQMDKRFEQVDKRFEDAHELSMTIIYTIAGLFGFIIWDRRTMINSAKKETIKELEPELVKKADKNILNEIIAIIEEMAKKDKEVENILLKHHLKLS